MFGDGTDYDWALEDDDAAAADDIATKPEMRYQDVRPFRQILQPFFEI